MIRRAVITWATVALWAVSARRDISVFDYAVGVVAIIVCILATPGRWWRP